MDNKQGKRTWEKQRIKNIKVGILKPSYFFSNNK